MYLSLIVLLPTYTYFVVLLPDHQSLPRCLHKEEEEEEDEDEDEDEDNGEEEGEYMQPRPVHQHLR